MRKLKVLLLLALMVIFVFALTSCGKVAEPTEDDVKEALIDEGYIKDDSKDKKDKDKDDDDDDEDDEDDKDDEDKDDKDDKSDNKLEIKIDSSKLNDDKDECKIKATVIESYGSVDVTTEYALKFKLKDKKSGKWKCKSVEKKDQETALKRGIDDDEAKDLIKDYGYYYIDDSYYYSEDLEDVSLDGEHELDPENYTDKCTYKLSFSSSYFDLTAKAEVSFYYSYYDNSGRWYISDIKYTDVEKEVSEDYKFSRTDKEIAQDIIDYNTYVYIAGDYCYPGYEGSTVDVTSSEYSDPDGSSYLYVDVVYDADFGGKIQATIKAQIEYYYDGSNWTVYYVDNDEIQSYSIPAIEGKWSGKKGDDTITVEIAATDITADNYATATVTVNSAKAEKGTYSYTCDISMYDTEDGYVSMSFVDWVKKPADGSTSYDTYSGYINNDKWTSSWSGDFEFTRSK